MALVKRLQISNRFTHLARDVCPSPGRGKGIDIPLGTLGVVQTARTRVAPREAWNACLTRQTVQFNLATVWSTLFKPDTGRVKFSKPGFAPNVLDVADERVPSLQQRAFVSLIVATVPSMLKESIEEEIFFSAKVARAVIKAMKPSRIE